MEAQVISNALAQTLDANPQVRKQAEQQLLEFEKQPGFTVYCLDLAVDSSVPNTIKSSASVFFKNRILNHWSDNSDKAIKLDEQETLKTRLIESLVKTYDDSHIRPQLTLAVRNILLRGAWVLNDAILQLLNSKNDISHVYTGLVLLFEATRSQRWAYTDRTIIETYIEQTFPILEELASGIVNNSDYRSGEMLYLILKIFRYTTLNVLPKYFFQVEKLSNWISLHLTVIQRDLPKEILDLEPADRSLDKRVKAYKWGFGNLHRFFTRFGIPTSKVTSPEFIEFFNQNIVPEILKIYFTIIEKWSGGLWLSDSSLFHLISFLEKCVLTSSWNLIEPHFDIILQHLIFPSLCQDDLELFEDDQEEYIRRYFDVYRESNTADVASVDFLFVVSHHRLEKLSSILSFLQTKFQNYESNQTQDQALQIEGCLRILSSISLNFNNENSPVKDQIEQIIATFILPHLSSKFEFLRARANETISIVTTSYKDHSILSQVFAKVYDSFKSEETLAVQVEAAAALKVLIVEPPVVEQISSDVPTIMQKLIHLSRSFELDMIGEVMESFVEEFSTQLEPFALDLGKTLCDQFIQAATDFLELQANHLNGSGGSDGETEKEYQAIGYINTMTTMTISMAKVNLEDVFAPAIKFVLHNAAIAFLGEALELAESLSMARKQLSNTMWELYQEAVESFQTFASEFTEVYIPFFENIVVYGFKGLNFQSPQVLPLKNVIKEIINSPVDFDNQGAFEIVEYMILTLKQVDDLFPLTLKVFKEQDLPPLGFIKILLAAIFIDPINTLKLLEQEGETVRLFEIWYNLSSVLNNVYGLKLQSLALLSLLSVPELPSSILGFVPQFGTKLIASVEKLPDALNKRQALLKGTSEDITAASPEDEDYDDDDDAFKDTPLDEINFFVEFKYKFNELQNNLPDRYQSIIGSLTPERINSINELMKLTN
ncbi:Importin-8 [Wickerhamomyces ciferrii]|uniref:Importin-8 n=1 Tax=Wickerhamomyces ciferrii (strain ATCC 14091 / BCRC 22168 / CBS 111 / JCM 3599 / NBRC 0793 / NRRL Y-1031 F-60-10) TaxID=1206466 RepID=K0KNB7_WICCF|nr:Importin-8 [Wickerhamomyces ciferrii]CCH43682.1 Importin-8 [Wickerhamomyces ciferrii]